MAWEQLPYSPLSILCSRRRRLDQVGAALPRSLLATALSMLRPMRALLQRVTQASVSIEGESVAAIGPGLLILLGVEDADSEQDIDWLVPKVAKMRIFGDEQGKMNRSLAEIGGKALVVSQFTLHASTRKGNRPSFLRAAAPAHSEPLYEAFCRALEQELGQTVGRGVFGAEMKVSLVNDGPVTLWIDSRNRE